MTTMTLEAPTIFVLTPKAKTSAREKTTYTQKPSTSWGTSSQDTLRIATTQKIQLQGFGKVRADR